MKNFYLILLFLVLSHSNFASALPPVMEGFVKLDCIGITTPVSDPQTNAPIAPKEQTLLTMYFLADTNQPYPKLSDLRRQYPDRFDYLSQKCNAIRYSKTTPKLGSADWGNDRKYQRVAIGEVQIPKGASSRDVGAACSASSQCTSSFCRSMMGSCQPCPDAFYPTCVLAPSGYSGGKYVIL